MNKRYIGSRWEQAAADFLCQNGLRIIEMNFKAYRGGEIDIICMDSSGVLVFVEVKYRKGANAGYPEEAVSYSKISMICKASDYYRLKNKISYSQPCRYDVIAASGSLENPQFTWYKNAFEYVGECL